jgi:KipI family sensor histidine kinase inhibitor
MTAGSQDRTAPRYRLLTAGDTALAVEFEGEVNPRLGAMILALADRLSNEKLEGVTETIPAFRSLLVHYEPLVLSPERLSARLGELMRDLEGREQVGNCWRIPVCYDPSVAPDLVEVAARTGFSCAQVIERHSAVLYYVYMLGFLPGQAYMGNALWVPAAFPTLTIVAEWLQKSAIHGHFCLLLVSRSFSPIMTRILTGHLPEAGSTICRAKISHPHSVRRRLHCREPRGQSIGTAGAQALA